MHSLVLTEEGKIYATGLKAFAGLQIKDNLMEIESKFVILKTLEKVTFKQISAGDNHNLALSLYGEVWGWGKNDFAKLQQKYNVFQERDKDPTKVEQSRLKRLDAQFLVTPTPILL